MRELDPSLLKQAEELNIDIKGTWGNKRIEQALVDAQAEINCVLDEDDSLQAEVHANSVSLFQTLEWANERAAKIWEGQSTSLSILERVGRIKLALKQRGFTRWDDLVIPTTEDYKIYL